MEKYLKCIYLLNSGYIHDCDINSKKTKSLYKSIACVGNPELYDKMFKIPKTTFVNHVLGRRKTDVKVDLNKLYDVMKDNFVMFNYNKFRALRAPMTTCLFLPLLFWR